MSYVPPASPLLPFRPHLRVLTARARPEPVFVAAWTGTDRWLRVEVPAEVLLMPRARKLREVGRLARAHHAGCGGSAGPFGAITGYLLRTLPDHAIRFGVSGEAEGKRVGLVPEGRALLGVR